VCQIVENQNIRIKKAFHNVLKQNLLDLVVSIFLGGNSPAKTVRLSNKKSNARIGRKKINIKDITKQLA